MAGSCVKNRPHSAHKNYTDMDSRGLKEKGASNNNTKEDAAVRDEKVSYLLGECHKISSRQGDLKDPAH